LIEPAVTVRWLVVSQGAHAVTAVASCSGSLAVEASSANGRMVSSMRLASRSMTPAQVAMISRLSSFWLQEVR